MHEFLTEKGKPSFQEAIVVEGIERRFNRNSDGDEINSIF